MRTLPYREEAMSLINSAKQIVASKQSMVPIVAVLKADKTMAIYAVMFDGHEKYDTYRALWDQILPENPQAIFMLNDSYMLAMGPADRAKYRAQGSLESRYKAGDKDVKEGIFMTVFPRGEHAWGYNVPYDRRGESIQFEEPTTIENESGTDIAGDLGPQPWLVSGNRDLEKANATKAN